MTMHSFSLLRCSCAIFVGENVTKACAVVYCIDEADVFLGSRSKYSMSECALNAILYNTGSERRDFMLILATSRWADVFPILITFLWQIYVDLLFKEPFHRMCEYEYRADESDAAILDRCISHCTSLVQIGPSKSCCFIFISKLLSRTTIIEESLNGLLLEASNVCFPEATLLSWWWRSMMESCQVYN